MPKIFISYRRADSNDIAERIYDNLANAFGEDNVFKDQYSIKPGEDFREAIRRVVSSVDVLLVLIGPDWLTVTQPLPNGTVVRRIDHPDDWVRREVEAGLNRLTDADNTNDVQVIPLLVRGAVMPSRDELPESIRHLAFLQAYQVRSDSDFRRDIADLIIYLRANSISKPVTPSQPEGHLAALQKWDDPSASSVPSTPQRPSLIRRLHLNEPWAIILAAIITGLFAVAAALISAQSQSGNTPTPSPTTQVAAVATSTDTPLTPTSRPTDQPVATFTPTTEPSPTPLPPSATPSPTDAPTPIPPSPLPPVSISIPTVVLPDTTILVTAWQNAHCIFTPDDGSIPFGFDTSTGNIQYSVKHKSGTTVSIVCEDALGRHIENIFKVNNAEIPTVTLTPTATNILPSPTSTYLPTATILTKSYPCDASIIFTNGAMLNQVKVTPQKNAPTRQPVQQGALVLLMAKQRNDGLDWYQIKYDTNTGWIPSEYIIPANTCPTK